MLRKALVANAFRRAQQVQQARCISYSRCVLKEKNDQSEAGASTTADQDIQDPKEEEKVPCTDPTPTVTMVQVPQSELDALKAKNDAANDQLLRALAETENVRRIARIDVRNAKEYSIGKFAKSLLEVADNLQRAHQSISMEELNPEHSYEAIKSLHEGVVMTDVLLLKAFKEFGIVPHGAVGDKFDPNQHDAMFEFEDADKEAGTVGQVVKSGYRISERVLRPAQVGTIKK